MNAMNGRGSTRTGNVLRQVLEEDKIVQTKSMLKDDASVAS